MRWLCQVIEHEAIDNNSGIGPMGVFLVSIHEIMRIETKELLTIKSKNHTSRTKSNIDMKPMGVDAQFYEKVTSCICSFR